MTRSFWTALAVLLPAVLVLPACLDTSQLQCIPGTVQCGDTCVETSTDSQNCGACGAACSGGNVCVGGACVCPVGQGVCNGLCTNVATDPKNCGQCGLQCGASQACNQGVCQDCSTGTCQTALVAACISGLNVGNLVRVHDAPGGLVLESPVNPPGASFPDTLGVLGTALLYADDDSSSLFEVPLSNLGAASSERPQIATIANAGTTQVFVEPSDGGSRIYTTASSAQTILVFAGPPAADAGALLGDGSGALGLVSLGGYAADPGSYPEPFAKIGDDVFVPLNATGKVLRVNLSNPASAQVRDTYDLQALVNALPGGGQVTFDGGTLPLVPSPTQAIARNGAVYVAANVLRYTPVTLYGPPLVARIDPTKTGQAALSAVGGLVPTDGGTITCQNVEWVAPLSAGAAAPSWMLVSCAGARTYDMNFDVTAVSNTQLVVMNGSDQVIDTWSPSTGLGQPPPSVGRAVPQNNTVYVADETASRLYVVDLVGNNVVERVGYVDGGTPPQICPSYISDLKVVPAP